MSGELLTPVHLHGGSVDLVCDWLEIDGRGVLCAVSDFVRTEVTDLSQLPAIKGYVGGLVVEAGTDPVRCYLDASTQPLDLAATEERVGYAFWRFDDGRLFLHRHWGRENVAELKGGRWHDLEDEEPAAAVLILATGLPPLPPPASLGERSRLSSLAARST